MLPTTSRRGLPSNPRPLSRSRSAVPSTDDTPSTDYRNDLRQRSPTRPAKHLERSQTPPHPESRRPLREDKSRLTARLTHKSKDSASSTTSSLFERIELGSGYASSRTSPEEEEDLSSTSPPSQKPLVEGMSQETGTGEIIWNRVATVASNLTVSVSKAWAAKITTFAGEETPPGQESRLTRAMKAYHLEKAQDPNDLPSWLFEERERRRPIDYNALSPDNDGSHRRPASEMPKSRGLRDIYDAYRPETPVSAPPQRSYHNDLSPPSRATDRLKALRDAKRAAANSTRRPEESQQKMSEYDARSKAAVTQRPRVGLPSGPRRT